jgi:hypothetical protein
MKLATLRILVWSGLALGLGGTLFFLTLFVALVFNEPLGISQMTRIGGPPGASLMFGKADALPWAAVFCVVSLASWWMVRSSHGKEPIKDEDALHLSLSDLVVATFACGSFMGVGVAAWGTHRLAGCALLSIGYGVFLIAGFMFAERHRIPSGWRYLFSFSVPIAVHGALAIGALSAGLIWILLLRKSTSLFLDLFLKFLPETNDTRFLTMGFFCSFLRVGLCIAPFGVFLCWVAWSQRPMADPDAALQVPGSDRRLTAQKALGWVGLAIGLGGLALFFLPGFVGAQPYFLAVEWTWPAGIVFIAIASGCYLLRVFRRTPGNFPLGFRTALVGMFLCVLVNVGMHLLGIYQFAGPCDPWTVPMSEAMCLVATVSLGLILMRVPALNCYALAFGLVPLILGGLAAGAFVVAFIVLALHDGLGSAMRDASNLLSSDAFSWASTLAWALRPGLLLLPVGALLCWLALRRQSKAQSGRENAAEQKELLDQLDATQVKP